MLAQPLPDGLHTHLPGGDFPLIGEIPPYAQVRLAVGPGKAHGHLLAVLEAQPPRTLHLQEKSVHGVGQPCQFQPLAAQDAGPAVQPVDFGPRIIRNGLPLFHAVHDALADKLALEAPQIQLAQIRRHTVQRGRVAGLAGTACLDDWLIVSRKGSAILELHPAEPLRQQAGFGVETGQQGLKAIQRLGHIAPRHRHIAVRHRDLTGLAPSDMRPAGPQGRGQLLPRMQALPGAIELPRQHGGLLVVLGDKIARDVPDRS